MKCRENARSARRSDLIYEQERVNQINLNERAQLLTMLLDGAPMQMPGRRRPALIDAVLREALRIAKG